LLTNTSTDTEISTNEDLHQKCDLMKKILSKNTQYYEKNPDLYQQILNHKQKKDRKE